MGTRLAKALLRPINTSAVIIMALYTFMWGIWVGNSFWTVFDGKPLYRGMVSIMPEFSWGIVAVITSIAIAYGVFRPSYRSLLSGAFVMFFYWGFVSLLLFSSEWHSPAGLAAGVFCVYGAYIWLNIHVNKLSE